MSKHLDSSEHSKKRRQRRNAVALSVGTCLLMGILGFELIRHGDDTPAQNLKSRELILPDPKDARLQKDLSELESRLYDMKRLLFVKDSALENNRLQTIREKLKDKDSLVASLEDQNRLLSLEIEKERQKLQELEKTLSTLLDTVELHKGTKEQGQEKLYRQLDDVKFAHAQELDKFERELAKAQEREELLRQELHTRLEEIDHLEVQKNQSITQLREQLNEARAELKNTSEKEKLLSEEKFQLTQRIQEIQDNLKLHEQGSHEQAALIRDLQERYEIELSQLKSKLESSQLELEAQIAKSQLQSEKIADLEESLKNYIVRTSEQELNLQQALKQKEEEAKEFEVKLASLHEELSYRKNIAYASEDEVSTLGQKGADLEEQLQIENTLRAKITHEHEVLSQKLSQTENIASDSFQTLHSELEKEKTKAYQLEKDLERNVLQLASLTQSLEDERSLTHELTGLKEELSQKLAQLELKHNTAITTTDEIKIAKDISDFNLFSLNQELSNERNQLQALQARLKEQEDEIAKLHLEIEKHADTQENNPNQDLAKLNEILEKERNDLAQLEESQRASQEIIQTLTQQLEKERSLNQELESLKESYSSQIESAQNTHKTILEEERARHQKLLEEHEARLQLIEQLNGQVEILQAKHLEATSSLLEEKERYATLKEEYQFREELISKLSEELNDVKNLRLELDGTKEELHSKIAALTEDNLKLIKEKAHINSNHDAWILELNRQHDEKTQEIERLKSLLSETDNSHQDTREQLRLEIEKLKSENEDLKIAKEEAVKKHSQVEANIDALNREYEDKKREVAELSERLLDLQTQSNELSALKEEKAGLEKELAELQKQNADYERLKNSLQQNTVDNEEKEKKLRQLEEDHAAKNKLIDDLNARLLENESKSHSSQSEINEEILSLKSQIDSLNREKDSLTKERAEIQSNYDNWILEANRKQEEKAQEIERLKNHLAEVDTLHQGTKESLQNQIEELKSENESLKKAKEEAEIKHREVEAKIDSLNREYDDKKAQIDELNLKLMDLQSQSSGFSELKEEKARLEKELDQLQKQNDDYERLKNTIQQNTLDSQEKETKLRQLEEDHAAKNKLIDDLNARLQENEKRFESTQSEINDEINSLKNKIEALIQENESLIKEKNELENSTLEKSKRLEELESYHAQSQNEIAEISSRLSDASQAKELSEKEREARINELQKQIDLEKKANEELSRKLTEYSQQQDKLQALENDQLDRQKTIDQLNEQIREEKEANQKLQEMRDELNRRMTDTLKKHEAISSELELIAQAKMQAEKRGKDLEERLNDGEARLKTLIQEIEQKGNAIGDLVLNLEKEKALSNSLSNRLADIEANHRLSEQEKAKARSQVEEQNQKLEALKKEYLTTSSQIADLKNLLEQERKDNAQLRQLKKELLQKVQAKEDPSIELEELTAKVEALSDERDFLKQKIEQLLKKMDN